MRWFGESWDAPVNETCEEAPTPIGMTCRRCEVAIAEADRGMLVPEIGAMLSMPSAPGAAFAAALEEQPYHLSCWMESILGPHWRSLADGAIERVVEA